MMNLALLITALVLVNALYVAAEFAAVSIRRSRVDQLADEGHRLAQRLAPIVHDGERLDEYVAACQVGITLANLVLGVVGQISLANALRPLFIQLGGFQEIAAESAATTLTLFLLTGLMLIFGELLPKSIALRFPEPLALWSVPPMSWSLTLLRWPIALFNGSGALLLRLLGIPPGDRRHLFSTEEIRQLVSESQKGGALKRQQSVFLRNLLRFTKRRVHEAMLPRTRIFGVEASTPLPALLELAVSSQFTRIPVYEGDLDHILGLIHLKDLIHSEVLRASGIPPKPLRELLRPVLYEPEAAEAGQVLRRMQQRRIHMAIVVDEYGGTAGLVTLEDLLEEIVGEVQDEFDEEIPPFRDLRDGRVRIRGDVPVEDVNERFDLRLDTELASTIGGYVMARLGRVPQPNDRIELDSGELRVHSVDVQGLAVLVLTRKVP
jgi:magnesium and cobalt exporter, CNNM family